MCSSLVYMVEGNLVYKVLLHHGLTQEAMATPVPDDRQ